MFKYDWPLVIYVRRRTCKGCEMCYESEFLKCLDTKTCGPWIPAFLKVKEGASRERKVHPRCKDPSLKKYFVNLHEIIISLEIIFQMSFVQYVKLLVTQSDIMAATSNPTSVNLVARAIVPKFDLLTYRKNV